jgi:ferredoxin
MDVAATQRTIDSVAATVGGGRGDVARGGMLQKEKVAEGGVLRVRVDDQLCHGHQMCAISAPEVFGSDDYGNAVVLIDGPIPVDLEAATRRAEGNCPERAVIITEDD